MPDFIWRDVFGVMYSVVGIPGGGSVYGDDNRVAKEAKAYSHHKSIIKKNHPLLIMVYSQISNAVMLVSRSYTLNQLLRV